MSSLLRAPNEILAEVASCFNYEDTEDLDSLLSLRAACRRTRDVVTTLLRGKLTLHLSRNIEHTTSVIRSIREHAGLPSSLWSGFSALSLDSNTVGKPTDTYANISTHGITLIYALSHFFSAVGKDIRSLEVTSHAGNCEVHRCANDRNTGAWYLHSGVYGCRGTGCDAQHFIQDVFFKSVSIVLHYASCRRHVDNLKRLSIDSGCGHYISNFEMAIYDNHLVTQLDKLGGEGLDKPEYWLSGDGETCAPMYLRRIYPSDHNPTDNLNPNVQHGSAEKWNARVRIPLLNDIECLTIRNRIEPMWDMYNYQITDPRPRKFDSLIASLPNLKRLNYDAGTPSRCFYMARLPSVAITHFTAENFGRVSSPSNAFYNIRNTLTSLEMINCQLWHQEWFELRDGWINTSHTYTIDTFLDNLLPSLPALEKLRIEGLGYNWNHFEQLIRENRPVEPWKSELAIIEGAEFKRPVITPFLPDIEALVRLRNAYAERRKEKGLQEDEWSVFLKEKRFEVCTLFTARDLRDE